MKRILLAVVAFALAQVALAACDVEFVVTTTVGGAPFGKVSSVQNGLDDADVQTLHKIALEVVNAATKVDKGGPHQVSLDEFRTCNGARTQAPGIGNTVHTDFHGWLKIGDAVLKAGNDAQKIARDRAKAGKKKAWGG